MASMFFYRPHPVGMGRLFWLVIGLLTLAVMAGPGRHFFINAWKNFKHHQANMDTLIAMGTGTAWLYSMAVVAFAPWLPEVAHGIYFEASAMRGAGSTSTRWTRGTISACAPASGCRWMAR